VIPRSKDTRANSNADEAVTGSDIVAARVENEQGRLGALPQMAAAALVAALRDVVPPPENRPRRHAAACGEDSRVSDAPPRECRMSLENRAGRACEPALSRSPGPRATPGAVQRPNIFSGQPPRAARERT
jgi:hypothetical protein